MCEWTVEAHEKREIVQEKVSEKVETQGRSFFFLLTTKNFQII